jgi:hypothetical protein
MKIKFRSGAEQGNEHGKEQRGEQWPRLSVVTTAPGSPWCSRSIASSRTPPTENRADHSLRRGAGACALFASRMSSRGCARFTVADQRPSLAAARSTPAVLPWLRFLPQPAGQQNAPATKQPSKIVRVPDISNRNWLKNRSYRKQTTKPCLTGARTAQCDAIFFPDFGVNFLPAEPDRDRPPVARRTIES